VNARKPFRPRSLTKRARSLIRGEITHFYGPTMTGSRKKAIKVMEVDANNYNCGDFPSKKHTDWQKGSGLVDAGCFRCYHDDQAEFLKQIYGDKVKKWPGDKIHKTYASLIGREYAAMKRKAGKKGGKR